MGAGDIPRGGGGAAVGLNQDAAEAWRRSQSQVGRLAAGGPPGAQTGAAGSVEALRVPAGAGAGAASMAGKVGAPVYQSSDAKTRRTPSPNEMVSGPTPQPQGLRRSLRGRGRAQPTAPDIVGGAGVPLRLDPGQGGAQDGMPSWKNSAPPQASPVFQPPSEDGSSIPRTLSGGSVNPSRSPSPVGSSPLSEWQPQADPVHEAPAETPSDAADQSREGRKGEERAEPPPQQQEDEDEEYEPSSYARSSRKSRRSTAGKNSFRQAMHGMEYRGVENRKRAATMAAQSVTRADLEALFHLSLRDAAARVGVRASCFLECFVSPSALC